MRPRPLSGPYTGCLVLAVSILLHLDPPSMTIYVEPGTKVPAQTEGFVAKEACAYLKAQGVPLPVPYRLVWFRQITEGPQVPDHKTEQRGLLTKCG